MATFNIFEAAALLDIPRVVYISSMSVLGLPFSHQPIELEYLPIDEAHPHAPQDAYALSKALGEDIAMAFVRRMAGALSVASLRFPWIHRPETFQSVLMPLWDDPAGGATNLWGYIDTRDVALACRPRAGSRFQRTRGFLHQRGQQLHADGFGEPGAAFSIRKPP